ncbi:hypothetical protein MMC31_001675 [Peltigera leucophlebia]|nr:hypothetical protein [Peltigera leucophlebia]
MLRSGRNGSIARSIRSLTQNKRTSSFVPLRAPFLHTQSYRRPSSLKLALRNPLGDSIRHASSIKPVDKINPKEEKESGSAVMEAHPETVSLDSSVRQVFKEKDKEEPEEEEEMLAGVYSDWKIIKETLNLESVPREAIIIGMAGVLPYLATSLSTIYLAWDINYAAFNGEGFLLSGKTAELLLHIIEPIQIGYGAVIISFLGAIHWGLEWAKYGGVYGYTRYAPGVIAPAVAWPTLLLPIEYALISQFFAFTFLYYADAQAVTKGRAPHWYTTYRFILTFVVGASIVLSLIGRGQIADKIGRVPGPADRMKALRDSQMESLEQEERERRAKKVAEDENEDED